MKLARRRFLHLATGAAALPIVSPAAELGQGTITPTNAIMIVERTQYFAIFVKHPSGDGSEPDVAWQCTFADAAAHEADLAARAASAAFENIRVQMRKLLVRFERQVFSIAPL